MSEEVTYMWTEPKPLHSLEKVTYESVDSYVL